MRVIWSSVIPANQWGGQVWKLPIDLWTAMLKLVYWTTEAKAWPWRIQEAASPLVSDVLLPTSVKYTVVSDWLKYTGDLFSEFYGILHSLLPMRFPFLLRLICFFPIWLSFPSKWKHSCSFPERSSFWLIVRIFAAILGESLYIL